MREGDAAFEALRAAIDELAAAEAPGLLEEARAEARTKVRSILAEAIAQALLDHSGEALGAGESPARGSDAGDAPLGGRSRSTEPEAERRVGADGPGGGGRSAASPRARPADAARGGKPGAARNAEAVEARTAQPRPGAQTTGTPSAETAADASTDTAGARSGEQPSRRTVPTGRGWYVYCVLDPRSLALPAELEGVAGSSVTLIGDGDIAALASEVPLSEFGEESLRENLNDVAWLEDTALAHERVLETVLAQTTVIPMRLCTIYSSEGSVRDMLAQERAAFGDALARLEGRTEWGVKVFVDRSAVADAAPERSEEIAALRAEVDALPEGEAYLKRKQLDRLAAEEADDVVDECVDDVHARVSACAAEALLNPLQRPEVSGHPGEMVLNGVYLVEDVEVDTFHAAVSDLRDRFGPLGFEVEPTGPWPPYNFVKSSIEAAR